MSILDSVEPLRVPIRFYRFYSSNYVKKDLAEVHRGMGEWFGELLAKGKLLKEEIEQVTGVKDVDCFINNCLNFGYMERCIPNGYVVTDKAIMDWL